MQNGYHEEEKYEVVSSTDALMALNASEIDTQIATAKRYPRSVKKFQAKALELATLDEETAAACFYSLPRSGKAIKGESIRLAEIALHAWGNSRAGARITEVGATHITAQATAIDLEANVAVCIEKRARITDKYGKRYNDDMVTTTCNAVASKAFRDAVFKIIPKALMKGVIDGARRVAVGDMKSLGDRRERAIEWFTRSGATHEQIFKKLGRAGLLEITLDDLELLTGLKTAIKEGEISIEDAFAEESAPVEKPESDTVAKVAAKKAELLKKKETPPTTLTPSVEWSYTLQGEQYRGMTLQQLRDSNEISADMSLDGCTSEDMRHLAGAMAVLQVG